MWINWEHKKGNDQERHSIQTSCKYSVVGGGLAQTPLKLCTRQSSVKTDAYTIELVDENKRLWQELKEKSNTMIGLRDEIYHKQRQLEDLERYREEVDQVKNNPDRHIQLIREIHQLKGELREKKILINFLNEMVENLCDEVLQNEHIECMEMEIETLESENRKLTKENSEMKVKLKLIEHDNEKMHSQFDQIEEESQTLKAENQGIKKKLEKTMKKLKEKESSMLSFKKFQDLANNLKSRINRSKSENVTLRNVIERMKHVAENYNTLEEENTNLKEIVAEMEMKNESLQEKIEMLHERQIKMHENEEVTKPELKRENSSLQKRVKDVEKEMHTMYEKNSKLKSNLKVYEKVLIENKGYIERVEGRLEETDRLDQENRTLKEKLEKAAETLNRELAEKFRIASDNSVLQKEKDDILGKLQSLEKDCHKLNRECIQMNEVAGDLRRQLQVFKNTIQNQENTLRVQAAELQALRKDNGLLKSTVKQYENQFQMAGKIYKPVSKQIIDILKPTTNAMA